MSKIKFGFHLPTSGTLASPSNIISLAESGEELGFDSVWAQDHISYGRDWLRRGIFVSGRREDVTERYFPNMIESLTTLAVLAGKTSNLRLGTGVLVPALRNPILLAKQAASLQELSNGRLILGVGIGDYRTEFNVLRVSFKERSKITDEWIEVLRSIWSASSTTSYKGRFIQFEEGEFYPKPRKIPILVGGGGLSQSSLKRASRLDGWLPAPYTNKVSEKLTPEAYRMGADRIKELRRSYNLDLDDFEFGMHCLLSIAASDEEALILGKTSLEGLGMPAKEASMYNLVGSGRSVLRKVEEYSNAGVKTIFFRVLASSSDEFRKSLQEFSENIVLSF